MEDFYKPIFDFDLPAGLANREDHRKLQEIFFKLNKGIEPSYEDIEFMDDYKERIEAALTLVELSMGDHITTNENAHIELEPLNFPMLDKEIEWDDDDEEAAEILASLKRKHSPGESPLKKKRKIVSPNKFE